MTWQESKQNCKTLGSFLVTIHSKQERDFAFSLIPAGGGNIWTGAKEVGNVWIWEDGKPWGVYTAWGPGEPNGGNLNHCLQMYKSNGNWNDRGCSSKLSSVCKIGKQYYLKLATCFLVYRK